MGRKYWMEAFIYPYKGYNDAQYQTDSFIKFIAVFIVWKFKYFGVDASTRKHTF